ncbi:MAG: hypothetical protein VKJ04_02835 [Vampirovibrionales bacterium]|nr:hypothetical protein [Vampirovibrionales bacterium]
MQIADKFSKLSKQTLGLMALILPLLFLASACSVATQSKDTNLLATPVVDQRLSKDDFGFPSRAPSLKQGREVFGNQCISCHSKAFFQTDKVKRNLNVTTPIDLYLMLSSGEAHAVVNPSPERVQVLPKQHPAFRDKLSRDERWAVLFYARYLAGAGDMPGPATAPGETVASIFGGNCAVCHGTRGLADGPLHLGKTGSHEIKNADIKENLLPPPARFHDDYARMYNRSDAQLFKYVCEGIYPSAMPSWYGNVHRDPATNKIVYVFDSPLISRLIRHVRGFAYENDLPLSDPEVVNVPKGLGAMGACKDVPTNRPWTQMMQQQAVKRPANIPSGKTAKADSTPSDHKVGHYRSAKEEPVQQGGHQ